MNRRPLSAAPTNVSSAIRRAPTIRWPAPLGTMPLRGVRNRRDPPPVGAFDQLPALAAPVLGCAVDEEHEIEVHRRNRAIALNADVQVLRIEPRRRGRHEFRK